MARNYNKSISATYITVVSVFFLIVLVQTQELDQFEGCGGCWSNLDALLIVRGVARNSRHLARDDVIEEEDEALNLDRGSQRRFLGRSESLSTSVECQACWTVLKRLRSYVRTNDDSEITGFGRRIKKTMLNNGWWMWVNMDATYVLQERPPQSRSYIYFRLRQTIKKLFSVTIQKPRTNLQKRLHRQITWIKKIGLFFKSFIFSFIFSSQD